MTLGLGLSGASAGVWWPGLQSGVCVTGVHSSTAARFSESIAGGCHRCHKACRSSAPPRGASAGPRAKAVLAGAVVWTPAVGTAGRVWCWDQVQTRTTGWGPSVQQVPGINRGCAGSCGPPPLVRAPVAAQSPRRPAQASGWQVPVHDAQAAPSARAAAEAGPVPGLWRREGGGGGKRPGG